MECGYQISIPDRDGYQVPVTLMMGIMVCYQNRKVLIKTAMVRLIEYPSLRIRNYDLSPYAAEPKPGAGTAGGGHHSNTTAYGQCFYKDTRFCGVLRGYMTGMITHRQKHTNCIFFFRQCRSLRDGNICRNATGAITQSCVQNVHGCAEGYPSLMCPGKGCTRHS